MVNLVYPGKVLPMDGFGYLVPAHEPELILGVVFDSCVFPEQVGYLDTYHCAAHPAIVELS